MGALSSERGLHLYKAAHEGLSNALRHSGATHIRVRLSHSETGVVLRIEDNGHGIPGWTAHAQPNTEIRATAMGLRGMQHRLHSLGGECIIESGPGGTRLSFVLPRQENLQQT
jgi:signal transduction histidine kinase